MKVRLLFFVFMLALVPVVSAQLNYCYMDFTCDNVANMPDSSITYEAMGYISGAGHYSDTQEVGLVSYPYTLCCPSTFEMNDGSPSFEFSKSDYPVSNGSGHVGVVGSGLTSVAIGTNSVCSYKSSCGAEETCLFNVSNNESSHAMDCYASDNPVSNSFDKSFCCKVQEICYDGIDNDLDGFIDCADSECNDYSATTQGQNPQLCSNSTTGQDSPYNTSRCVVGYDKGTGTPTYNESCKGQVSPPPPGEPYFYCGYGQYDDQALEPTGVCCPVGFRSLWNPTLSKWICQETAQCGIASDLPCNSDFDLSQQTWYSSVYSGDAQDWCNTQVDNLLLGLDDIPPSYEGSTGCCLIPKHGEINYWLDENNVKIWG